MTHWYDSVSGAPVYEVKKSDGSGMRASTLRDARKMNLVVGVTSVIQCAAAEQLEKWKREQIISACLKYDLLDFKSEKDWKDKVLAESQRVGLEARSRGQDLHDKIEKYIKSEQILEQDLKFVLPVIDYLNNDLKAVKLIPEESFSHPLGFGGKIDLHGELADGTRFILDFKTKKDLDITKKLGYNNQLQQLSAYRIGLNYDLEPCRLINLFICTEKPGVLKAEEWNEEEFKRGWLMFKALLDYWKALNNYYPGGNV